MAVVKELLVKIFVFVTVVLTKINLTHTDRHDKYFINKKNAVIFILFIYCKTSSSNLSKFGTNTFVNKFMINITSYVISVKELAIFYFTL